METHVQPLRDQSGKPSGLPKHVLWPLAGLFFAIVAAEASVHDSALVETIAPALNAVGIGIGVCGGLWLSYLLSKAGDNGQPLRKLIAMATFPFLGALVGAYSARLAQEIYAFTNVPERQYRQLAVVESKQSRYRYTASVVATDGNRLIEVRVTPALYQTLDPYRQRGTQCLDLRGEIGRAGIRRVGVPPRLLGPAIGRSALRSCP